MLKADQLRDIVQVFLGSVILDRNLKSRVCLNKEGVVVHLSYRETGLRVQFSVLVKEAEGLSAARFYTLLDRRFHGAMNERKS